MTENTAPTIEFVTSIPEPSRAAKNGGGSVYSNVMKELPAPKAGKKKDDPTQYASFFAPAVVSETITDATERTKAAKDACRKLSNQFSSIARRVKKEAPTKEFAFRTMQDADGRWGVRVFRTADSAAPAAAPGTPPPPPPAS